MEKTFTYTARSALVPEKVVTFTLYDHQMAVDVGAPLEQIERVLEDVSQEAEAEGQEGGAVGGRREAAGGPQRWGAHALMPTTVSLMERVGRPFEIADVYAQAKGGGLVVTSWVRAKGLRLAPIRFAWKQVDNPQGAEVFSEEVAARREKASHPGRFRGVMDYWVSWLALGVVLLALLLPRGKEKEDAEQG